MRSNRSLEFGWSLFVVLFASHVAAQQESPSSLSGFESNELYQVEDGVALDPDDPMLRQLLSRCSSTSTASWDRYAQFSSAVSNEKLLESPQKNRFWVFQRQALVTRIARQKLPEGLATQEFSEYWLLIATDDEQTYAIVSRTIPKSWRRLEKLNEPIEMTGFFFGMKTIPNFVEAGQSVPLFVCDRVSWFPDREMKELNLGASQLYLASQGVDLGYLDMMRQNQKRRMLKEEGDYFYQMLSAAIYSQENPDQVGKLPSIGFRDLIQDPNQHVGSVIEIEGTVRRIVAVPIVSEARRKELGIDQFYEMDMYVSLKDIATIHATDKNGKEIVYKDRFPVTVHMATLPEPVTEYAHHRVRVKGFFYRLWSYQSEFSKQTNQASQPSPLLISFEPKILRASTRQLDLILTVGGVAFVLGVFSLIWFLRMSDRRSNSALSRTEELPEKIEIPT